MDFLGLINGDNLFKYCFTLGLAMLVFSLIYPLEKQHLIQLEIVSHNKETELLNKDIEQLNIDVDKLKKECDNLLAKAQAFEKGQTINKDEVQKRVSKFNNDFKTLQNTKHTLDVKNIVLTYNQKRINVLESQSKTFGAFSWVMIITGIGLTIFGFIFWVKNTFKEMKEKNTKK